MHSKGTGLAALTLGIALAASAAPALADDVTLTLASWRTEDLAVWQVNAAP